MEKVNKKERTLIIIKPDGVQRSLIGEVIQRLERVGLKLVAVKMVLADENSIEKHYTVDSEWIKKAGKKHTPENATEEECIKAGEKVLHTLKKFMTASPIIPMVWEGANASAVVRKLVGRTEPLSSEAGTIRGDYVLDSYKVADADGRAVRNIIHASESEEFAKKEVNVWFIPEELVDYRIISKEILYDVNLDGLKE